MSLFMTQKEAMVALLQGKIISEGYWRYRMVGDNLLAKTPTSEWIQSMNLRGFVEVVEWNLTFESALACMRDGKICQCEIAPEFNFWMNAKKRIVAGEPTARLGPKANGHIVELCDDHFTARWRVAQ
jgi:hypothetical protein